MATLFLTGNRQAHVSDARAQKIIDWKNDEKVDLSRLIDIGTNDFIELRQIKQIKFIAGDPEEQKHKATREQIALAEKEEEENRRRYVSDPPDVKAKRMIRTGCLILFKARLNKPSSIEGELYDELMIRLIKYFEENPKEWWAGAEVYQFLIPSGNAKVVSKATGFKSIGELMLNNNPIKLTL